MGRLIDIDALFDYFGNDAINETTRSNIEYFVSEKGTVEAIPKAVVKKVLEEGTKNVSNNVLAIVREDYIHKADYEARLKADLVAMLEEIQLELDEMKITKVRSAGFAPYSKDPFRRGVNCSKEIIQQKIDSLKGGDNDSKKY